MLRPPSSAARLRGWTAGALTAALAATGHGLVTGSAPDGGALGLLAVLAAGIGALVDASERARSPLPLIGILAAGQLGSHLVLSASAHHHAGAGSAAPHALPMVGAHLGAVIVAGLLVAAAEHLFVALSRVVGGSTRLPHSRVALSPTTTLPAPDQPLQHTLLVAASISHRGPPALPAH